MIMVIDDEMANADDVRDVLREGGHQAVAYVDARQMLDAAAAREPELVISDVMMPEVDGFELRRRYQERFPERATPFIFLSSLDDPDIVARGIDEGADDYLVKPVPLAVLLAKVRAVLRRRAHSQGHRFRGDLAQLPLSKVLRFCESRGLTGYLDLFLPGKTLSLELQGGQIQNEGAEEHLGAILAAGEGALPSTPRRCRSTSSLAAARASRRRARRWGRSVGCPACA